MLLSNMLWEHESGRLVLHAMPLLLVVLLLAGYRVPLLQRIPWCEGNGLG